MSNESIIHIDFVGESKDFINVKYYHSIKAVIIEDYDEGQVEISRETAIAAARAILKHFNEAEA